MSSAFHLITPTTFMQTPFQSHLTVLESSGSLYASSPAFKVPKLRPSGQIQDWETITYNQFKDDVEASARYWERLLSLHGIPRKSVIGLWLGGMTYIDVLHVYGVSRAGYVPQLFSLRLPNPLVVFELLQKANARALIYDASYRSFAAGCHVPVYVAADPKQVGVELAPLPQIPTAPDGDEIALVFHTSGSTSGSPKLVPCTYAWLNTMISKACQVSHPMTTGRSDVTVWMGSMCHIGQNFMLLGSLQHGSCTIQPTKIAFSSGELLDMIHHCGLNRLNQFATFLTTHLRSARHDSEMRSSLRNLDEILYSGLALASEEEDWAYQNGIKLRNLFGSTECGAMMLSIGGSKATTRSLRPLRGVSYEFFPSVPEARSGSGYRSTGRLLELVILADSGDCPHPSLRQEDGHFHTGDLFQEVSPGHYISRGRDDDWIKSENGLRCDTKAIEDNVRSTCAHLVEDCIVVGNGRPSPVLYIEPAPGVDVNKVKKEIIRKTRPFHARRYIHERITSTRMILAVPPKSLPRTATKGNIRRTAVEEMFKAEMDALFAQIRVDPRF